MRQLEIAGTSTMHPNAALIRVHHPHVTLDDNGSPVIAGTRIPVRRIWSWNQKGVPVDTLVKRYPQLGPAKVMAALAFAHDNRELIEVDLAYEKKLIGA